MLSKPNPKEPILILASSSPYRRALLAKLGLPFEHASPDVDETPRPGEAPSQLAIRLAEAKARALVPFFPGRVLIGSDQVASLDGRTLGKPGDRTSAAAQLRAASGRVVVFHTAVSVLDTIHDRQISELDTTQVAFRPLSEAQITAYLDREIALDCAGAFKSEGLGITLLARMETEDPNALVGLPLIRLTRLLETVGVRVL